MTDIGKYLTLAAFLVLWLTPFTGISLENPCGGRGTSIVVFSKDHRLWLCDGGEIVKKYRVALGSGGVGKQRTGDNKTPQGVYSLGQPRPSQEFGLFIPMGYPNREDRRRGRTGGAIGIHGPKDSFRWAGGANAWVDWTRGCIAVGTLAEIEEIAQWVRMEKPGKVYLE